MMQNQSKSNHKHLMACKKYTTMIRNCNQIIRDVCNCVWRLKAYTTDGVYLSLVIEHRSGKTGINECSLSVISDKPV